MNIIVMTVKNDNDKLTQIDDFGSKGAAFFSGVNGYKMGLPKVTRFQNAITFVLLGVY
jgi:hypothetical protein